LKTVYLSLGSNLGDREANLRAALDRLEPRRISPIYETSPVDYRTQPFFLNLVAEVETGLMPLQLLSRTQRIERELGRVREVPKGPRVIDIDILLFDARVMRTKRLEIPHPRMQDRRFVLVPLADLVPHLRHPVSGLTIEEMRNALPETDSVRLMR
jgi:2-amino-4-hydroxy-6-hydroxymethyldihydropteridine diphosphokinase